MQMPKVTLLEVLVTNILRKLRECWSASGHLISNRAIRNVPRCAFCILPTGFSLLPLQIGFAGSNAFVVLPCEVLAKTKQVYWNLFLSCILVLIYRKEQWISNFAEYCPIILVWQNSGLSSHVMNERIRSSEWPSYPSKKRKTCFLLAARCDLYFDTMYFHSSEE